ncbi:hypothetical protein CL634_09390 [bacterium]|nr:hypothetical protein [bacterium]
MADVETPVSGGQYFASPPPNIKFISSGCELLDCVLGGGWAIGRIANVVGDRSTGKTLLAIEAAANFASAFLNGHIFYREAEAAFDLDYAEALGMPIDRISFNKPDEFVTVEDFYNDLSQCLEQIGTDGIGLYILDSLDALSDKAEIGRGIEEGTFGASKAKQLSQVFRRITQKVKKSNVCVIIVSQVRDNIGVAFGEKHTRSGGRALDFYASQILWLARIKNLTKTRKSITRTTGIIVRAKCKKNKVGIPYRECDFPITFGYGVDDFTANLDWLKSIKRLEDIGLDEKGVKALLNSAGTMSPEEYTLKSDEIATEVRDIWSEIETSFLPTRKKYGQS